jgi:hypothetical protein
MSFSDYLNGVSPKVCTLDLMHSASVSVGAHIIHSGELAAHRCPVYNEDLVYLFYGRPAYKPLSNLLPTRIPEYLPMCLVLDSSLIEKATRILPFDSGGYDRYRNFTGPELKRSDFELGPNADIPMRLVTAFFQTNKNYFQQKPTSNPEEISVLYGAARAYGFLTLDPALANDDDRRSTIEIQISQSVPLADVLRAVVGPPALLSDDKVVQALDLLPQVQRVTYETYGRQQPSAYTALLYEYVARYLVAKGSMP